MAIAWFRRFAGRAAAVGDCWRLYLQTAGGAGKQRVKAAGSVFAALFCRYGNGNAVCADLCAVVSWL